MYSERTVIQGTVAKAFPCCNFYVNTSIKMRVSVPDVANKILCHMLSQEFAAYSICIAII